MNEEFANANQKEDSVSHRETGKDAYFCTQLFYVDHICVSICVQLWNFEHKRQSRIKLKEL